MIILIKSSVLLLLILALIAVIIRYGEHRWAKVTRELRTRLESTRSAMKIQFVDFNELEGLPLPVQRYFRTVLIEGQPMITGVHVQHLGAFNMDVKTNKWKPFRSDQRVILRGPCFDWDARIFIMPGLQVHVHDAYVAGEGILHAALSGIFTVAKLHGTVEIAEGELMRFFAETVWYPTALLPGQDVLWEAVNDHSARGTIIDGAIKCKLLFIFNEQGLIDTIQADSRGRMVGDKTVPTPWRGRFWNYVERDGMQIPLDGEVSWLLPEGEKTYWRGNIRDISYNFTQ